MKLILLLIIFGQICLACFAANQLALGISLGPNAMLLTANVMLGIWNMLTLYFTDN